MTIRCSRNDNSYVDWNRRFRTGQNKGTVEADVGPGAVSGDALLGTDEEAVRRRTSPALRRTSCHAQHCPLEPRIGRDHRLRLVGCVGWQSRSPLPARCIRAAGAKNVSGRSRSLPPTSLMQHTVTHRIFVGGGNGVMVKVRLRSGLVVLN
jgi:hypothetical protein